MHLKISGAVKSNLVLCHHASCAVANTPLNVIQNSTPSTVFVAGGYYESQDFNLYPLLVSSSDLGQTWAYTITSTVPALSNNISAQINGTNSNGALAIAVGSYITNSNQYPLLASSTDEGQTWTNTINSSTPTLPGDFVGGGAFVSSSCSGLNCIASGSYNSSSLNYPLLASSTNGGQTWVYNVTTSTPALPSDYNTVAYLTNSSIGGTSALLPARLKAILGIK